MKILDAGHKYRLEHLDGKSYQELTFVKRQGENFPFNVGEYEGTNCQEVLRALIDRSEYLQRQKPCAETECIVSGLKTVLLLFELRAARHHNRHLTLRDTQELISGKSCKDCGHIGCNSSCPDFH